MGEVGKEQPGGLTGWDILSVLAFCAVFFSIVGLAYRTGQMENPPGWMVRPVTWLSVDWFPPTDLGWMNDWHWVRVIPWATGLAMTAACLVRVPTMLSEEEKPEVDQHIHDPTYVIRHNGLDTPELDHLSCVLWTSPGDHEPLCARLEAYNLPFIAKAVRMVPLNTRPNEQQQEEAEKGRSMDGLG